MEKWTTLRDLAAMHDAAVTIVEKREIESVMLNHWSLGVVRRSIKTFARMKKDGYRKPKRLKDNQQCVSYFVECVIPAMGPFVKIGEIRDVATTWTVKGRTLDRFRAIQCGNPLKLILVGVSEVAEDSLHAMWSDIRYRGEWFTKTSLLEMWMNENVIPWSELATWGDRGLFQKQAALFQTSYRNRNINGTP